MQLWEQERIKKIQYGGSAEKGGSQANPLGCISAHWRDIAGEPGGTVSKKTLIEHCKQWRLLYKLGSGEKWPVNGTLIYNTLRQLMFQEREGKWEETTHADMFFTLRHHPEWQRDWGMLLFHV